MLKGQPRLLNKRLETLSESANFTLCPRCGGTNIIELPELIEFRVFADLGEGNVRKLDVPAELLGITHTCRVCNEKIYTAFQLDEDGMTYKLVHKHELISILQNKLHGGTETLGALIWDGERQSWIKFTKDPEPRYYDYNFKTKLWDIPLKIPELTQ